MTTLHVLFQWLFFTLKSEVEASSCPLCMYLCTVQLLHSFLSTPWFLWHAEQHTRL